MAAHTLFYSKEYRELILYVSNKHIHIRPSVYFTAHPFHRRLTKSQADRWPTHQQNLLEQPDGYRVEFLLPDYHKR